MEALAKFDTIKGEVTYYLKDKGCFIETLDGFTVFLPNCQLKLGTVIYGTVIRISADKYPLVSLDSIEYNDFAA